MMGKTGSAFMNDTGSENMLLKNSVQRGYETYRSNGNGAGDTS